jgi:hypothetical protein
MNREDAKKAAEIMSAYADGAKLQFRYRDDENGWGELTANPFFNWLHNDYRIKPPEPKLVPFTYEDNELFLGKVVIHKDSPYRSLIIACYSRDLVLSNGACDYDRLLKEYVFKDGSQCGKIIYE